MHYIVIFFFQILDALWAVIVVELSACVKTTYPELRCTCITTLNIYFTNNRSDTIIKDIWLDS